MESSIQALRVYLNASLGLDATPLLWAEAPKLPLYLRESYDLYGATLLGLPCVFMVDKSETQTSPALIIKHRGLIEDRGGVKVIYVTESISPVLRSRLVAAKVPFVVPGKQLYLPPLGIDFRELYPKRKVHQETLSPAVQVLFIRALYEGRRELSRPSEFAAELGYSKMTIGRAFDELEATGAAMDRSRGKERRLVFAAAGKALWETMLPKLVSPVKKTMLVSATIPGVPKLALAGISALAHHSILVSPDRATYAVAPGKTLRMALDAANRPYDDDKEHTVFIEIWKYDPRLIKNGPTVDTLSLYLSLREEKDERVQQALERMMEAMQW